MKFLTSILFATFLFCTTLTNAQSKVDYTSTGVTMSVLQNNGKWSEYPKFKKTEVPVKIDFEKNRIVVYSEVEQLYRIAEYYPEKETKDEFINFFKCLSNDGEVTEITLKTAKKENASQIYIKDKSRVLIYNLKRI